MQRFAPAGQPERNGPQTRHRILECIRTTPGQTKTELKHAVGLAWGTTCYHLRLLVRDASVVARTFKGSTRYFAAGMATTHFGEIHAFRQPLVPALLELVQQNPGIGIQQLSRCLESNRKTVAKRLDLLVTLGILQRSSSYRTQFFLIQRTAVTPTIPIVSTQLGPPPMELRLPQRIG